MTRIKKLIKEAPAFFSTMGWCLSLSWKGSRFYTLARVGAETLAPLFVICAAFVGRYLIDLLAGAWAVDEPETTLLILFSLQLMIAILISGSRKLNQYCQSMHEDILENRISVALMENALAADVELFDNPDYYDKLQSTQRDSYAIMNVLWSAISCLSAAVSFVVSFAILSQANAFYGLMMIAAAIPSSVAAARYTKLIYRLSLDQINGQRVMAYYQGVATDKRYTQDIRLFNAGGLLKGRYARKWRELFTQRKGITRRRTILTSLLDFIPEIAIVLIGISIARQIVGGSGTVGDYSLFTGLIAQLWSSVIMLSASVMQIYDNQLKIANFKTLSSFKTRISDEGKDALDEIRTIGFENVSFTYPGAEAPALEEVSFTLRPKEKIAVVGLNGSGKSTLIKLLLRMYEPDSGAILINGKDLRMYPVSEVRRNFSVYFQDMHSYCLTLRENLAIADAHKECTDKEAEAAFRDSGGAGILERSPKRLDASLTKFIDADGIELSGGEYQKVALARTFFRSHTALILDEPSSNLDPEAEDWVFQSLRRLTEGKLTIFTSHRLSNVSLADRILVLEKGRVLEFGTQDELMKNGSRYSELFRYQRERYMVSGT